MSHVTSTAVCNDVLFNEQIQHCHHTMHRNLRTIRAGTCKQPNELFQQTLKHSAELVLLRAERIGARPEDRIQLLYEAGRYDDAQHELDEALAYWGWGKRLAYRWSNGQLIRAIRRAVAQPMPG